MRYLTWKATQRVYTEGTRELRTQVPSRRNAPGKNSQGSGKQHHRGCVFDTPQSAFTPLSQSQDLDCDDSGCQQVVPYCLLSWTSSTSRYELPTNAVNGYYLARVGLDLPSIASVLDDGGVIDRCDRCTLEAV